MRKEKAVIFGAAGTIGQELVRQLHKKKNLYVVDINEAGIIDLEVDYGVVGRVGDIRDYDTVNDVFSDIRPSIVYHAAAYKGVNTMETVPLEAIKTNCIGTYNLLHCAKRYEVPKFVFISTDKVVNSRSVMGQSKKLAETMVVNQGYTAVRFGNILGSRGSVINIWQRQMDAGRPLTVTDDRMQRYLMTIEEAVDLVVEAGEQGKGGEIWVLDMKKKVNILDLAKQIAQGYPVEVIGARPGETLDEHLMTDEEKLTAVKHGKFFII